MIGADADAPTRESPYTAITGKDVTGLDGHQLPARRKSP
jgi:hypothetical protein